MSPRLKLLSAAPLQRVIAVMAGSLLLLAGAGATQAGPAPGSTPVAVQNTSPSSAGLAWRNLSAPQKQALQPLASHWHRLSDDRKRKWLVISRNYAKLPAAEQAKLHRRMSNWASLSQQQRAQARRVYSETKTLSAEQKAAQWEAYQALSPEEKRRLAAHARARPAGVATVKPASSSRRAVVPPRRPTAAASDTPRAPIHAQTLLPRPAAAPAAAAGDAPASDIDTDTPEDQ